MHPTHAGAAAPKHITALHEFFKSGDGNLFAVRQGARTIDALQQASCFLEVALDSIDRLAAESESLQAYGAQYLLTLAHAAVSAAEASVFLDERAATSLPQEPTQQEAVQSPLEESRRGVSEGRTTSPLAVRVATAMARLEHLAADSRRQAEKEEGQGRAFYDGRVSAFELALSELREVAQ